MSFPPSRNLSTTRLFLDGGRYSWLRASDGCCRCCLLESVTVFAKGRASTNSLMSADKTSFFANAQPT